MVRMRVVDVPFAIDQNMSHFFSLLILFHQKNPYVIAKKDSLTTIFSEKKNKILFLLFNTTNAKRKKSSSWIRAFNSNTVERKNCHREHALNRIYCDFFTDIITSISELRLQYFRN